MAMTTVTIELTDSQAALLAEEASRHGLKPEDLVRAAVADIIEGRDSAFLAAARRVVKKNAELYDRLA